MTAAAIVWDVIHRSLPFPRGSTGTITAVPSSTLTRDGVLMDETGAWANEVRLVGRVSADAEERELPSGDLVVQLRVVVPRTGVAATTSRVDTIDVACWSARTRRSARRLESGAHVEVHGALRRRFFRSGAATVSRYEIEATSVARLKRR